MTLPDNQERDTATRASRPNGQRLTRRRIPLSCVACRTRKLKCNREKPCQNCIARGEVNSASCTYAEKVYKKNSSPPSTGSDAEDMRKRLNRLENAILSMIETNGDCSGTPSSSAAYMAGGDSLAGSYGQAGAQMISADTRSTAWDAILNEIGAMKDAWSEENDKIEYTNASATTEAPFKPSLLSGLSQPPDRVTILGSLPSRETTLKLINRFFDSYNPALPAPFLIHRPTFLKEYENHWENPTESKIIWVGLLFGALCIAMRSYARNGDIPPEYEGSISTLTDLYRIRTAQCILIADLTKPVPYMIETLMFYTMIEYWNSQDGDLGTWLLSGTIMRIALQQGYHRDPSQHPNLTPFQREMRRRLWTAVSQHELIFSTLVGLPKFVKYAECDTEPPRNLHEEELYEEMEELPPSRPLSEPTIICYHIIKAQVMRAYGSIVEFLHLLQPQSYEEVLRLDLNLMETRENIPAHLRLGTLEGMRNDTPARIMEKCFLQLFYHKAAILLHRKFWDAAPVGIELGKCHYSRKTCVNSAVAILDNQALMHEGCRPGGALAPLKWYHFVITNHDFLLAAMVLCLDIMNLRRLCLDSNFPECVISEPLKLNAIRRSRSIWAEIVDQSWDAKRAVTILDAVLGKLAVKPEQELRNESHTISPKYPVPASTSNPTADSLRPNPYFSNQSGFEAPLVANEDTIMQDTVPDIFATDLSLPSDFNWEAWDQLMQVQQQ